VSEGGGNEAWPQPLGAAQVAPDARLFWDRSAMLRALCPGTGKVIGEVGVGLGHLSRFILSGLRPSRFVAIDSFDLHTLPMLWGKPAAEQFGGLTHRAFYERSFADAGKVLEIMEGQSDACLAACPDASFDLLYIDAGHDYDSVKRDAEAALRKIKPAGLLVFNDYTLLDHHGHRYGVVQAVNELLLGTDWQMVGFSLQQYMYCDVALRRPLSCPGPGGVSAAAARGARQAPRASGRALLRSLATGLFRRR
jgi:hypothetical protein